QRPPCGSAQRQPGVVATRNLLVKELIYYWIQNRDTSAEHWSRARSRAMPFRSRSRPLSRCSDRGNALWRCPVGEVSGSTTAISCAAKPAFLPPISIDGL